MDQNPRTEDLLTEVERQESYLAELPKDFNFPLFSGKQAVESQRRSGYKSTARAAREIVDNAIEAGAKNVYVLFDRPRKERDKSERHDRVSAMAFIDDGPGMVPTMLRYALTWGGGTHFKHPKGIGKFGFGLPNSSINQTRRVEVYSRTKGVPWHSAVLDINEIPQHGLVTIPAPTRSDPPTFVNEFLEKNQLLLESGTVVVWVKPDRLTYRVGSTLREHLIEDFGVVYRGLLDRVNLQVESTKVQKVDPLFMTPGALLYKPAAEGGAECTLDSRTLPTKFFIDPETGAQHLELLASEIDLEKARRDVNARVGVMTMRIARFPYGFVRGERQYKGTDEYKRFEIRKPRRGMAFLRAGREIDTVDVFPKSSKDEASGLGDWPLLQSYAYHWGIEVSFGPELDEAFGIGNDKQTVRPIEDFWRVLVAADIHEMLHEEENQQRRMRKAEHDRRREEAAKTNKPSAAIEAAAQAAQVMGGPELAPERKLEARKRVEEEIKKRTATTGQSVEEVRKAIEREAKRWEYGIDFFSSEGGVFFKPDVGNGYQRLALINKLHPFFDFYSELLEAGDLRLRNAVDLLLLALADAELRAEGDVKTTYEHERESRWSPFLKVSLKVLDRLEPRLDESSEQQEVV